MDQTYGILHRETTVWYSTSELLESNPMSPSKYSVLKIIRLGRKVQRLPPFTMWHGVGSTDGRWMSYSDFR
jgi:hypothetical protein